MDSKAFTVGLGVAKRASITAAVSAVLMAGLHYAPLRGFSPGDMLFGHPDEVAVLPAAPQPTIRFIAIPAREAFPPAAIATVRRDAAPARTPSEPLTAERAKPAHETLPMTVAVVPTARPAYHSEPRPMLRGAPPAPLAALEATEMAELQRAPRRAEIPVRLARRDEVARADAGFQPPRPVASAPYRATGPVPELELIGEAIPEPEGDQRRFEIADLVPDRRSVVRGVTTVGKTVGLGARFAVNGIADTALAIVGR